MGRIRNETHEPKGGKIFERRRLLGMTQQQVADAAGIARFSFAEIESGRRQPRVGTAFAIARALTTTVEQLFGPDWADGDFLEETRNEEA